MTKSTLFNIYTEIIRKKEGTCLSTFCNNQNEDKINIRCSKGHEWSALGGNIKKGGWCPECAKKIRAEKRRTPFEIYKKIINEKGGTCLSTSCNASNKDKITVRCANGHEWEMWGGNLKRGCWCQTCMRENRKTPFSVYLEIIKNMGAICISKQCSRMAELDKISIKCAKGHIWTTRGQTLKQGGGCPYCTLYKKENICRAYLERFLGKKFIKTKPEWLTSSNGYKLELDGYCEELKLAFEYQGEQHYMPIHYFRGRTLKKTQEYDLLKKELCTRNNVDLIEIHYHISIEELGKYLLDQCEKRNLEIIDQNLMPMPNVYGMTENIIKIKKTSLAEKIVQVIEAKGEICNQDISKEVNRNSSFVSVHLTKLIKNGILIKKRRRGKPQLESHCAYNCIRHHSSGIANLEARKAYTRVTSHSYVYYQLAGNKPEAVLNA